MCAVVYSYCMSHQHYDAKILNISHGDVWVVSHGNVWGNLLLNRLVNPYQNRYAWGGI